MRTPAPEAPPTDVALRSPRFAVLAVALPAVAAGVAYAGSLGGDYVYDDHGAIAHHAALQAGDWWGAAFGDGHTPLAGRPVTCLSFVLGFAVGLDTAPAQRWISLLLHVLVAAMVAVVARRALRGPVLGARFDDRRAAGVALALATLFAAHPMAVDAVAYATQRSMLLMAAAFLTAVWATLRSHASPRRTRWLALACGAVAIGMGCKEEFAAAPILIGLLPFAFLEPTFASWRRYRGFHLALASTWVVLLACVVLAPANRTVGFATAVPMSAIESLYTQAPAVVHYAVASLWPAHLLPVYEWPIVRSPGPIVPFGVAVLLGLAATAWLWRRHRWWAWLGTMFFLLLAPTSSVLPILTELVADRRAYLPKLALLAPAVVFVSALLARFVAPRARTAVGAALLLGVTTLAVAVSRADAAHLVDSERLWRRAYEANPLDTGTIVASTILGNHARQLRLQGHLAEANELLDRAAACEAMPVGARTNHGISLLERGRVDEGIAQLRTVLHSEPTHALATRQLCLALVGHYASADGRTVATADGLVEAERLLTGLVALHPDDAEALTLLGLVRGRQGHHDDAMERFRAAVAADPDLEEANTNLVMSLLALRRPQEAVAAMRAWAARAPTDADLQLKLAKLLYEIGDRTGAANVLDAILQRSPDHAASASLRDRIRRGL